MLLHADISEVTNAVKNLEKLSGALISDPSRLKKWYREERDANWNELVHNPSNKSFQEKGKEFDQKDAELHKPIFDSLWSMHKILCNISLKKKDDVPLNDVDYNSYVTVIKEGYPYLIPAELLKGLEFPFILAYIGLLPETIQEIQQRNAKLSDYILELCGIKKAKQT